MTLKTKFKIISVVVIGLALSIGFFIFIQSQELKDEVEENKVASEIMKGSFELSLLANDFLLHPSERNREQWQTRYQSIDELFHLHPDIFETQEEKDTFNSLHENHKKIQTTFSQFSGKEGLVSQELEERLKAELLIRSQAMVSAGSRLMDTSRAHLSQIQQRTGLFIIISIVVEVAIMLLALLMLIRSIFGPLSSFQKGVEIIGAGDLKYRIGIKRKDEIGQLAAAFDEMSGKLKRSYEGLEEKVHQRTRDLAEAKARDEAILASIGDGVLVTNQNGIVLLINAVGEGITGFSDKELVGHHYSKLKFIREKDKSPTRDFIKEAITSGKITGMENHVLLVRKDKKEIAVADSAAPVKDVGNKIIGAVVVFRDVTKEREIDRMKDEFLNIAAHELRTPLTAIRWSTSLIMQRFEKSLKDEKVKGMIEDMHASSLRLTEIVNDFLDVSKLEAGRIEFKKEALDMKGIIKKSLEGIKIVADKKGLYLKLEESREALPKVFADKDRFEQIIVNLLGNAIKFTEKGGVSVAVIKEGGFLKVWVKDTGVGIAKDSQRLLFQKFQQSPKGSYTRDATKGTGLGLYISKLLVEGMGGKIYLEKSEESKGSTFAFTLPVAKTTSSH